MTSFGFVGYRLGGMPFVLNSFGEPQKGVNTAQEENNQIPRPIQLLIFSLI